ncbi:MAG: dihydrofolate reductase [Burkholderiaceae bacterium]|nr:dihydrofolate reductase [Burkholderiaceae bacterium]
MHSDIAPAPRARLTIIVASARNGVIGRGNDLPWRLPADLGFFKRTTLGHPLVMGRRTFESIGRALPGRRTLVVTRAPDWRADGCETCGSLEEAIAAASTSRGPNDPIDASEVFIAGGGQIYAQALARADRILLTQVELEPEGDTRFGPIDQREWIEVSREPHAAEGDRPAFAFVELRRR